MLFKFAFRNLLRNPRRTAAILFTVAMGTGSLFIFHGFNTGMLNQYRENTVRARYGYGEINLRGYRDTVYERPWEYWVENYPELAKQIESIEPRAQVFPRVSFFALLTNGEITVAGRGQGVDGQAESAFFTTLNVEEGKNLESEETGIILGKGLARALKVSVGDTVTVLANTVNGSLNGIEGVVTGIFHTGQKDFDDVAFRVQLTQAQVLLDTQKVESVAIGLDNVNQWDPLENKLEAARSDLEATSFAILDKVYYQHSVDWLNSQFGIFQAIILSIVLLGIFNTVSVGVLERKQEIGNLRANGESSGDVLRLLTAEGALLGVLGGLLGIAFGLLMVHTALRGGIVMPPAPGITRQFHIFIEPQFSRAVVTFIMGTLTCLIGTVLAGIKVARMPIGEALRSN